MSQNHPEQLSFNFVSQGEMHDAVERVEGGSAHFPGRLGNVVSIDIAAVRRKKAAEAEIYRLIRDSISHIA